MFYAFLIRFLCFLFCVFKPVSLISVVVFFSIVNGGGEVKYPQSSFVLNCKGELCHYLASRGWVFHVPCLI